MKKLVLVVMTLCAIQITSAQGPNKGKKGMDMSPEDMATLQTKKMTLALDLTDAQQEDIYEINLENAKLRKAHMAERKAKRESGEVQKPTKEQRLEMANKRLDHMIEVKAKMKNILNDEQYTRWERMMAKRQTKMKDKFKGKKRKKA
ncbi:hypothetical protein EYD45_13605 [Hyunsoonleella flava]|uniref:DUF4890 domain-containing protein n=1 Tax=Hyunsoonleella flava TaxID=2527939 RepID=A0A4Q9FGC8_9FLAO|nr:Spy/CpxP family protein refolding chaperone [Hyunsoonleella flava]TBN00857.1 hypothetical protein EYD45_13605 [Hyunsoonleella flava]